MHVARQVASNFAKCHEKLGAMCLVHMAIVRLSKWCLRLVSTCENSCEIRRKSYN